MLEDLDLIVIDSDIEEMDTWMGTIHPTRNNKWKGTRGHLKDKSRYYETWFKHIRAEFIHYKKHYYMQMENDAYKAQLSEYYQHEDSYEN